MRPRHALFSLCNITNTFFSEKKNIKLQQQRSKYKASDKKESKYFNIFGDVTVATSFLTISMYKLNNTQRKTFKKLR